MNCDYNNFELDNEMKKAFKSYLFLTLVTILGTLSICHANAANTATSGKTYSNQYLQNLDIDTFHYAPIHQTSNYDFYAEVPEVDESENEESSLKTNIDSNGFKAIAFINAVLFQNFSNELEKSILRSPNTINRPKDRLFLQFQVFII
ncbi:MAG: hypothetical protein Tsb0033_21840 [Winogradskyella sp.]